VSEVGLLAAFAAGVLALLSPCSALLLPSFFAYAFASRTAQLARTGVFYVGLLITLVPLGVGAGAASSLFYGHRPLLIAIAGWFIIGLGVLQVLGRSFAVPFSSRLMGVAGRATARGTGWASTLVLGAVYGLAGFCSGPVLGAILTMAATQDSPVHGGLLLAVYALGMAAPLFALAALWDRFELGRRRWLRGRLLRLGRFEVHTTALVSGVLFVVIGVLFLRVRRHGRHHRLPRLVRHHRPRVLRPAADRRVDLARAAVDAASRPRRRRRCDHGAPGAVARLTLAPAVALPPSRNRCARVPSGCSGPDAARQGDSSERGTRCPSSWTSTPA